MSGEVSVRGAGRALVSYRVGGREYPLQTVTQCKVCMSPHRFDIEEALIAGRTYAKIVGHLPEDTDLSIRNVKDHYNNNHMPLEVSTTRQIVERRAEQVGKRIEDAAESLIDGVTLAQLVVQRAFERIAAGELEVEVPDGLRAFKLLADLGEYDENNMDNQAMVEAFMVYHEEAEKAMSPEAFEAFGRALEASPVLQALTARYEGDGTPKSDTVPGEVMRPKETAS